VASSATERRRRLETAASNLSLEALAREVVRAFRRGGIEPVLLRGVSTALWLYEDGTRSYDDLDLLVDPRRIADCELILAELGFRRSRVELAFPEGRPRHASTWSRGLGTVDLHRTLVGPRVPADEVWSTLSARTERWTIGGTEITVLDTPCRALVLALHMAQHGPAFAATREDLERALAAVPDQTWAEAASLARLLDTETSMAAGLCFVPGGNGLTAALGLQLDGTVPMDGSPSFHFVHGLLSLMQTPGLRDKARFAWTKLFPPAELMRSRFSSARAGRLALARVYAVRIAQTTWYLPSALVSTARLTRRTR
jgi:hypothetical protein